MDVKQEEQDIKQEQDDVDVKREQRSRSASRSSLDERD